MSFFALAAFTIFILILFAGIFLNLFGLPGTVIIFFDVLLYAIVTGFEHVGWKIIIFLFASSVIAEAVEFFWIISETPQQTVSSKKSIKAAVFGALTGVVFMTPLWGGTRYMDRILRGRSYRNYYYGNHKTIETESSIPDAECIYLQYNREKRS